MNNVTIIVSSCDRYSDTWKPFFTLFDKFGGDLKQLPIILMSEQKNFQFANLKLFVAHDSRRCTWSQRMLHVLEQIESEYILFLIDDYFLVDYVDVRGIEALLENMVEDNSIGYILMRQYKSEDETEIGLNEINLLKDRLFLGASLWRRDFFKSILMQHEDIWDCERYSHFRGAERGMKAFRYCERDNVLYEYRHPTTEMIKSGYFGDSFGITRGKWFPGTEKLFAQYNINVEFGNLGWYRIDESQPEKNIGHDISTIWIVRKIEKIKRKIQKKRINKRLKKSMGKYYGQ